MTWKDKYPKENRYFETENGILYNGDTWSILEYFPKKSVKLVIADPPYLMYRDKRVYSREWDTRRDWDSLFEMLSEVVTDDGCVFLFGLPSFYLNFSNSILKYFRVYFDMIWVKKSAVSFLRAKFKPLNKHEQILCLVKRDAKVSELTYNYRDIGRYDKPYTVRRGGHSNYGNVELIDGKYDDGFRYPTTVVEYPNKPAMPKSERTNHPTQKPIGLIEHLIKGWSNEGDLILDPFVGSGTTAVVAERLNRKWIGIEINSEYCDLVKRRVSQNADSLIKNYRLDYWIGK